MTAAQPPRAAAPQSTPEQKQAQTYLVRANVIGSLAKDMITGGYVVAFAVQVLALSNAQISWFLAILPLIVLLRYPFLDLIRRYPRVYPTRAGRLIGFCCLALLLVLPQDWITLPVLLAIAILFSFGNEFLQNSVWNNFVTEVTTRSDRGKFLGRLRTWKITTAMLFAVVGFFLVGDTMDRTEHRILLLVVMALVANALFWFFKTPATPPPEQQSSFSGRHQFWRILRSSGLMRRPLALALIDRMMTWPILTVYLIGVLNLPANVFMLLIVAEMLGPICSVFLWGRKADAGGVRALYLTYFWASLALYPLLFLVPDFAAVPYLGAQWLVGLAALLVFRFFSGLLGAGRGIADSLYRAHFLNDRDGFHAMNIQSAISALMLSAMTALGGLLLLAFRDVQVAQHSFGAQGFVWLDPFRLVMVGLILLICCIGIAVARRIDGEI